jgi:hypothetical protein
MRPVQPSVVAVQRHVMLSAVPSSGIVNSVIRITGIGDRDRPEWLIRISGMRRGAFQLGSRDIYQYMDRISRRAVMRFSVLTTA